MTCLHICLLKAPLLPSWLATALLWGCLVGPVPRLLTVLALSSSLCRVLSRRAPGRMLRCQLPAFGQCFAAGACSLCAVVAVSAACTSVLLALRIKPAPSLLALCSNPNRCRIACSQGLWRCTTSGPCSVVGSCGHCVVAAGSAACFLLGLRLEASPPLLVFGTNTHQGSLRPL